MQIEEKKMFLYQNISYILAPYFLFIEKDGVVSLDYKRIKNMDKDFIIHLTNFLVNDDNSFIKYINNLKNSKDYIKKYGNTIYMALSKQERIIDYRESFMKIILDNVKKKLNKDSSNKEKLEVLEKYYQKK